MMKRSILTTAVFAVGTAIVAIAPAHAGIVDGTLNNLQLVDHISLLDSNINSDSQSTKNTNANTRSDGELNNANGQHQ
ncbi:hypothetical protein QWM81_02880 [Streptomyces ficellus]|uniref:Secreted protein n=1 Tax=Streptomyces ficellus TaxID=1977088 RepID=A0ABT7Z0J2_9ACTN|nr:hypothetical protein [Streptomyces ficellus]MDN3293009.1 hypothetical protein [Streptomyces ficellus]